MNNILKKIAKYVHKNALEGANRPSLKLTFEAEAPEKWCASIEKNGNKK